MPVNGPAIASVGFGTLLLYSAIKGKSILATTQAVVSGKNPGKIQPSQQITIAIGTGALVGVGAGGIAGDALQYQGHPYLYGGAPGLNGLSPWDCSSFVNWVVGHDMGMQLPNTNPYTGESHGPDTYDWLFWSGATHISAASAQAGDLVVSSGHMGIITGPGEYISAHDPAGRTSVTNILPFPDTPPGPYYLRLAA